jgi:hypothetical protein
LVDPGFVGKLLIPLHNLTATEYDIDTRQALIWVEFTKTTYGFRPREPLASDVRQFTGFPFGKRNLTPDNYLRKANAGNPIRSSIPVAMADAQASAKGAARSARFLAIGTTVAVAVAGLGIAVALYTYFGQLHAMLQSTQTFSESFNERIDSLFGSISRLDERLVGEKSSIVDLEKRLDALASEAQELRGIQQRMIVDVERKINAAASEAEDLRRLINERTRDTQELR